MLILNAIAEPIVADAKTAGIGDRAVDDRQLAVVSGQRIARRARPEDSHLAAGSLERRRNVLAEVGAAEIVDHDAALHSCVRAFLERRADAIGGAALFPDVEQQMHAALG